MYFSLDLVLRLLCAPSSASSMKSYSSLVPSPSMRSSSSASSVSVALKFCKKSWKAATVVSVRGQLGCVYRATCPSAPGSRRCSCRSREPCLRRASINPEERASRSQYGNAAYRMMDVRVGGQKVADGRRVRDPRHAPVILECESAGELKLIFMVHFDLCHCATFVSWTRSKRISSLRFCVLRSCCPWDYVELCSSRCTVI